MKISLHSGFFIAILSLFVGTGTIAHADPLSQVGSVISSGGSTQSASVVQSVSGGSGAAVSGSAAGPSNVVGSNGSVYHYGTYGVIPTGVSSIANKDTLVRVGNEWALSQPAKKKVNAVQTEIAASTSVHTAASAAASANVNLDANLNLNLKNHANVDATSSLVLPSFFMRFGHSDKMTHSTTTYPGHLLYAATNSQAVEASTTALASYASTTAAVAGTTNGNGDVGISGTMLAALQRFFPTSDYGSQGMGPKTTWALSIFGLLFALAGAGLTTGKLTMTGLALNTIRFSL